MSDPFGGNYGGGSGGQKEMAIAVAVCCCSSMAVALFLWYAYRNQDKFKWLDWFFKLFKKGDSSPGPSSSGASPTEPSPEQPSPASPAEPSPGQPSPSGGAGPVAPPPRGTHKPVGPGVKKCEKDGCSAKDQTKKRNGKCMACKRSKKGCYQWVKVGSGKCRKSNFEPLLAGYDSRILAPLAPYRPHLSPSRTEAPMAYNERW